MCFEFLVLILLVEFNILIFNCFFLFGMDFAI